MRSENDRSTPTAAKAFVAHEVSSDGPSSRKVNRHEQASSEEVFAKALQEADEAEQVRKRDKEVEAELSVIHSDSTKLANMLSSKSRAVEMALKESANRAAQTPQAQSANAETETNMRAQEDRLMMSEVKEGVLRTKHKLLQDVANMYEVDSKLHRMQAEAMLDDEDASLTQDEPVEDQPAEEPPAGDKPAEEPPTEDQPAEEPPAEDKPAEEPPTEERSLVTVPVDPGTPSDEVEMAPEDETIRPEEANDSESVPALLAHKTKDGWPSASSTSRAKASAKRKAMPKLKAMAKAKAQAAEDAAGQAAEEAHEDEDGEADGEGEQAAEGEDSQPELKANAKAKAPNGFQQR